MENSRLTTSLYIIYTYMIFYFRVDLLTFNLLTLFMQPRSVCTSPHGEKQHPNSHPPYLMNDISILPIIGSISESSLGHLQGSHDVAQKQNTISWSSASWNAASQPSCFQSVVAFRLLGAGVCRVVRWEQGCAIPSSLVQPKPSVPWSTYGKPQLKLWPSARKC